MLKFIVSSVRTISGNKVRDTRNARPVLFGPISSIFMWFCDKKLHRLVGNSGSATAYSLILQNFGHCDFNMNVCTDEMIL